MAEKGGLHGLLQVPTIYNAVQRLFGAGGNRARFAENHIRARAGDRVLDIGCGTADLLEHLPAVEYIGWEPNAAYVETARQVHGARGTFHAGFFGEAEAASLAPVDIAIVSAVLHHLDDAQARQLFALLRRVVKPGGRVVTLDCAYADGQSPIARLLVRMDRGQHPRRPEAYRALASEAFTETEGVLVHQRFPPYTFWIMTAR